MSTAEARVATPPGRRVPGPSAFGGDWRRFFNLTWTMALTDFRMRFYGSALGYLWQLMRPLLLFGVLYLVFTQFVRIGEGVTRYPLVLLSGIVMFTFISEATTTAVTSVSDRENLVRKIHFPRMTIPLAVTVTAFMYMCMNLVVVLVFAILAGVEVHRSTFQLPFILGALVVCVLGLSMLLSSLYVRYRDVKPIWDVSLQLIFYGTPILWPIEAVTNQTVRELLMINPFACIVQQFRHSIIDVTAPTAAEVAGGTARLLIPAAILVGIFLLGLWTFNREAPRIAEEL